MTVVLLNTEEMLTPVAIRTIVPKVVLTWQDLNLLTPICFVMFLKTIDILGACPGVTGETLVLTLIIEDIASLVVNFGCSASNQAFSLLMDQVSC